jgi:hypothetical protein
VESEGYDGQFYLILALDPSLRSSVSEHLDDAKYRARRILWSALAWTLAAGQPGAIVWMLVILNGFAIALAGTLVGLRAIRAGYSPYWSLAFVCGIGCVVSLWRMVGDGFFAAMLISVGCLTDRQPTPRLIGAASILCALAVLQKETAVLALPLVLVPLIRQRSLRGWLALSAALAVVASWWIYIELTVDDQLGQPLFAINFALPGTGFGTAAATSLAGGRGLLRIGKDLAFLGVHALAVMTAIAVGSQNVKSMLRGGRPDGLLLSLLAFGGLGLVLSKNVWGEPWSYSRVLLPVTALLLLHVLRPRTGSSRTRLCALERGIVIGAAACGAAFGVSNFVLGRF